MTGNKQSGIRIVVLSGSVRPNNYTNKAVAVVLDELEKRNVDHEWIDPASLNLPMPGTGDNADSKMLQEKVAAATGVILATPEYHGSMSSVIKLVIENMRHPSALAPKPVALLGVAAGQIGAVKALEQLRSCSSHVGAIVLPGPVSIANVRSVFDEDGHIVDEALEKRIRGVAKNLLDYIHQNLCPRVALEDMVRGTAK